MGQRRRSAITMGVLGLLLLVAGAWGWTATTEPLPGKVDSPICVKQRIPAGKRIFPQDVTVSVYNAGTREGLAGRTMALLTGEGFAEGRSGNVATKARVAKVQVWTLQPGSPAVRLVASRLGRKVDIERRDSPGVGVAVVVGNGFDHLVKGKRAVLARDETDVCSPPVR
jgi:hypothetical protein